MEFIVLFSDSQTWSSDDTEYVYGNSLIVPEELCEPGDWKKIIDQEVGIEEFNLPFVSVSRMIRGLKKTGKWDELVEEARIRSGAKPGTD